MDQLQAVKEIITERELQARKDKDFYRQTAHLIIEINCLKQQLAYIIKNSKKLID